MTEMPSCTVENPSFELTKPKKQYNIYYSFLPIIVSIITYVLIFYVLDVSPSLIFNNTKILFFISNALVLIIAADFGAFSERENHDFYGEYVASMRGAARENDRQGYGMGLAEEIKKGEKQEEAVTTKDIPRNLLHREAEVPEKTLQVVSENIQKHEPMTEHNIQIAISNEENCKARKMVNPKPYGRSKSDKARSERRHQEIKPRPRSYRRSKSDDNSKWMDVHKEKKKAHEEAEEKWENVREESEEFAKMSNEELNRRVEDFIQRFNRDIKRQSLV